MGGMVEKMEYLTKMMGSVGTAVGDHSEPGALPSFIIFLHL